MYRKIIPVALYFFLLLATFHTAAAKEDYSGLDPTRITQGQIPELPFLQGEQAGQTTVSTEEERFLSKMETDRGGAFMRQPAFPGIEDNVISYPQGELSEATGCPFEDLPGGLKELFALPEACYYRYTTYVHYPQNTGSEMVDHFIKGWMEKYYAWPNMELEPPNYAGLDTYLIGRPSPRYISVAFCNQTYIRRDKHPRTWFVWNFDLETERMLELEDVFPDIKSSEALLQEYPLWSLAQRQPFIFAKSLDIHIYRIFLAPDGVYLIYSPYELERAGSGGILTGYIPRKDLAAMGVNTALWGE